MSVHSRVTLNIILGEFCSLSCLSLKLSLTECLCMGLQCHSRRVFGISKLLQQGAFTFSNVQLPSLVKGIVMSKTKNIVCRHMFMLQKVMQSWLPPYGTSPNHSRQIIHVNFWFFYLFSFFLSFFVWLIVIYFKREKNKSDHQLRYALSSSFSDCEFF